MLKTDSITLAVKIKSKEITGDEYNISTDGGSCAIHIMRIYVSTAFRWL